jgi:hypothetical protein
MLKIMLKESRSVRISLHGCDHSLSGDSEMRQTDTRLNSDAPLTEPTGRAIANPAISPVLCSRGQRGAGIRLD